MVTAASFCTLVVVPAADLQQIAIERHAKVQEFQRSHRVAVLTLVFIDIVDSTKLKQALGDREAVTAIQQHHAAIRGVLNPRSVNGKSWIGVKEVDLVRDAAKSLDAKASPSG